MPVDTRDVIELACTLSQENDLRVTVSESFQGGLIAGSGAMVGGLLAGPPGLAIGAAVGGCMAYYRARNSFKSVVEVLRAMEPEKQERLAASINQIISKLDITDAAVLVSVISGDLTLQKEILSVVITYLRNEMRMEIVD